MAERLFPILYLELNAVGLTILLIVLFSQQRTGHGSADQRFFSALALSDVAMLALDSAMWLLDGQRFSLARPLLTLASAAYYLLTPLVAYFWPVSYTHLDVYKRQANAEAFNGDISKPYDMECELERKRLECALAICAIEKLGAQAGEG